MIKTETQQVARCSTEVFKSNCDFKLENFVELPDLFYCSEKVTIPGTDFYWFVSPSLAASPNSPNCHFLFPGSFRSSQI